MTDSSVCGGGCTLDRPGSPPGQLPPVGFAAGTTTPSETRANEGVRLTSTAGAGTGVRTDAPARTGLTHVNLDLASHAVSLT